MKTGNLEQFLVKAKINTYASGGEGGEKILEDGKKEFRFDDGIYAYQDQYYGHNPFIGEETVWNDGYLVWGMNYYGRSLTDDVDPVSIYSFLKDALKTVNVEMPYRGAGEFCSDKFTYINKVKGTIENFTGKEEIYFKDKLVYELFYHGGAVVDKIQVSDITLIG